MPKTYQEISTKRAASCPNCRPTSVRRGRGLEPPVLVDVREKEEYRDGHLPGALSVPRGFLEMQVEGKVPDKRRPVIAYCQSGTRSLLAGRILKEMGYTDVAR